MKHSISKRLLALLLCLAMLLPYLDTLPLKAWAESGETGTESEKPLAVVGAGSDFQYSGVDVDGDKVKDPVYNGVTYPDIYAANAAQMKEILERIKVDYPTLDSYFMCGDYSNNYTAEAANAGIAAANGALKEVWGLDYGQNLFVQGNHDNEKQLDLTTGKHKYIEQVDATGAHDTDHYGVFLINHDNFSWGQSSSAGYDTVKKTADALDDYLTQKANKGYQKPIFVLTHVPLHHSWRTDNLWAELLVDVLNKGGEAGLNIIFLFGHNHSGDYDNYIGRDCIYLQPGDPLVFTDCDQYVPGMEREELKNLYETQELQFTYMNAGYLGYVSGDLTSTVFEIYKDRVEILRYNKNGLVNLRKVYGNGPNDGDWASVTTPVLSPQTLSLSGISLSVLRNTLKDTMPIGSTADIQIGASNVAAYSVTWSSQNEDVVTAAADAADPTKVRLTALDYGTTTVKVTVSDTQNPDALPAAMVFDVTVAPENAVKFNDSANSTLYRLVTDWSTIKEGKPFMILNRDTAGMAVAMAGPEVGDGRELVAPSTVQTKPTVFDLAGEEGLYTASVNTHDLWELRCYGNNTLPNLHQLSEAASFIAVTKKIDAAMSHSYECGFRFASSYGSGGAARWTIDAENKTLKLDSYYKSGTYPTLTDSYGLYYNSTEERFEISASGSPVSIYEWTGVKGPEIWMWLTSDSGKIVLNGNEVTGAKVAVMVDGVVTEIPITGEMLKNAYSAIPGTRTCSVSCYGKLVSDQFRISVTNEAGTVITPFTVLENNGDLYRLVTSGSLVNGNQYMLVPGKVAGDSVALAAVENADGTYSMSACPTLIFASNDGTVYVQPNDASVLWNASTADVIDKNGVTHTKDNAGYSFLSNEQLGVYLNGTRPGTAYQVELLEAEMLPASSLGWRLSGSYGQRVTTSSGTYIAIKPVNGTFIGVGIADPNTVQAYVKDPNATLDRIIAYVKDPTGEITASPDGNQTTGSIITVSTYYADGTFSTEEIPITAGMLGLPVTDLLMPGNYPCQVLYNGHVVCENFLLTVNAAEGETVADTPVVYAEEGSFYKFVTSMAAGMDYVIVNAKTAGSSYMVSVSENNGTYTYPAAATEIFTVDGLTEADGTDSLFVIARDGNRIFKSEMSGESGRYFLYNEWYQRYFYSDASHVLHMEATAPAGNINWRYSDTQKAMVSGSAGILATEGYDYYAVAQEKVASAKRAQLYLRDYSIQQIVAYVDALGGSYEIGSENAVVGGNVVLKTILSDGSFRTSQVPITLSMLEISAIDLLTPGEHTCKVVYDGVVISENYVLKVSSNMSEPVGEVLDMTDSWKFFELVTREEDFVPGATYVLADTNIQENANVMTAVAADDGYQVAAAASAVLDYNGTKYVIVKDNNWLWSTATHQGGLSIRHNSSGKYLGGTVKYELVLRDAPSETYEWRYTSTYNVATTSVSIPEGSEKVISADIVFENRKFFLKDRLASNTAQHIFAYRQDTDIQGMVIYTDSVKGQCAYGSAETTPVGGNIVVNTLINDITEQRQIPITLEMLELTAEQKLVPGTYTCRLVYQGQVLAEKYEITILPPEGEKLPADQVVTLVSAEDLVFRRTEYSWVANERYIFVNSKVEGPASAVGVKIVDGKPVIIAHDGAVFAIDGDDHSYFAVKDKDLIWNTRATVTNTAGETVTAIRNLFVQHEQSGHYLYVDENMVLRLGDADALAALPNGWRQSGGDFVTGDDELAPYAEIIRQGDTFVARNRVASAGMARTYILDDTVNTRIAYVDAVSGSCDSGAATSVQPGGNVLVKTYLEDGTYQTKSVPITLDMLSLDYTQIFVPGSYTCSVTYENQVICDSYVLTVNPLEGENPAVTAPVVLIAEADQVFRLYKSSLEWDSGRQYMFVDTSAIGEARIIGMTPDGNGGYLLTSHESQTFTAGDNGKTYVVAQADHQIWNSHKTIQTGSGETVTTASAQLYMENSVYGKYLFVDANYELLAADADAVAKIPNGWRISTDSSIVTGNQGGPLPYADMVPRGPEFVARYRKVTSGNTVGTARVYVIDQNLVTSLAYLDRKNGTCSINSTESFACGGNVMIKTVFSDGSVTTDTIPITLDMLQLSYEQKRTPGTYTCQVVYRGKVLCSDYQLTVTGDEANPQADAPVLMFENNGTVYKRVVKLQPNKSYVFVDSLTEGNASAMTLAADGTFPAEKTNVFTIDGGTDLYVIAEKNNWIWNTDYVYNIKETAGVYTLYSPVTGEYLHVTDDYRMTMVAKGDSVPHNSGWSYAGATYALGNGSSQEVPYITVKNLDGKFQAVNRYYDASDSSAAFIYELDDTLEGQVAYVTTLQGTCSAGSTYSAPTGGNLVVKTYHTDGTVTTQMVPITLSMLQGIGPMDVFVPGEHTCSVVYNGQVVTDSYQLTITGEGTLAASDPVKLADQDSLIFTRVTAIKNGKQYVFADRKTHGSAFGLTVIMDNGEFVLCKPETKVFDDGKHEIIIAKAPSWVWDATSAAPPLVELYNGVAKQYLISPDNEILGLGSNDSTAKGWRLGGTENLCYRDITWDYDVRSLDDGYQLKSRDPDNDEGYVYAYGRNDSIQLILGYLDSLSGTVQVGQSGDVQPGGNLVIRTFYDDGTSGEEILPVKLDMLNLTPAQLNTPGTYTSNVTVDGQLLAENYELTVTGEEPYRMVQLPGNGKDILGYAALLDSTVSDELPMGSGGRVTTGSTIKLLTYYSNGTVAVSEDPVLVDMLNATSQQLNTAGSYSGLTMTYQKLQILDDYTLRIRQVVRDDYPDFPNEGSVKVDKQMDTTKFDYLQTGSAQVNLSLAGIPTTSKANVVIVLDASSSMTACTHGVYNNKLKVAETQIIQKMLDTPEALTEEEIAFLGTLAFEGFDNPEKYMARIQAAINGTITASEMNSLKTSLRFYGYCSTSGKWTGDTENHCKTRTQVTKDALAELLTYLKHDIQGYSMDIDVAVSYFNQLYPMQEDLIFKNNQSEQIVKLRDPNEIMLPFTNIDEVDIPAVIAKHHTISGTNYDRGMEIAYQQLSEKQTQDYLDYLASGSTEPYQPRKDFVLFMSDGEPGQFNYMVTNNAAQFSHFFSGTIKGELTDYVDESLVDIFAELYHHEGKMWLAEAIKGDKTQKYKVIDPTMPETNYVSAAAGLGATMMTVSLNASSAGGVLTRIASNEDYYYPTETGEDISAAFSAFGSLVTSGSGSYFKDQMGPEFDLQTANTIIPANVKDLYLSGSNSWDTFTGTKTTRTVYFDNYGSGWGTARVYAWDANGTPLTGNWPGTAMTHLGNGVFTYEVPAGAVNIQFNDGVDSRKTADLKMPANGGSLYDLSESKWVSYGTRTVYFDATGCSWSSVYAYTWGGSGISTTGNWPGAKMIDLGNGMYSCEIPADATGIKFSENGGSQTGNLTVQTNGKNLYRYSSGSWDTYVTRTVYFNNSGKNWSRVCAYTWDENGNYTTSPFPGMVMTHLGGNIYACEIPADAQFMNFNNGSSSNQTADLNIPSMEIQLNSTITVSKYELYKYSEHLQDPEAVPMDLVGKRKDTPPTVLEQITFSDDGTQAYSNLIDGGRTNILIDGVICARNFWYNTSTGTTARIDIDGNGVGDTNLESETFYWRVDNIPEDELVLTYNVYLTGTLEGTREEGSYPTNDYATLYYTNHLGHPCELDTTSPMLPWNQAVVGYAFYLVDSNGDPLVNEDQHITGSFEKAIRMTQPLYINLLYNNDKIIASGQLKASDVLPEGYTLYDPAAAYHVALYANGDGNWQVTGSQSKLTTYVTGYGGVPTTQVSATAGMSTDDQSYDYPAYATASTVVWFAVRADVNTVPDTVVIDYGISVDIHVLGNDVVITNQNATIAGLGVTRPHVESGVDFTAALADGFTGSYTGSFGTAQVLGDVVRYTPNTVQITAEDQFSYAANYRGGKNSGYYYSTVTVIPATTIYFEDNFITFDEKWRPVGQTQSAVQDEDRVGSYNLPELDANNVYGYDSAYANMATWSLGSAMVARVSESDPEATAHFTFTGTGFDILSYCSSDTGAIIVDIFPGTEVTDTPYKSLMVDSYYQSEGSLYQVPIIKQEGLTYGTWTVQVYVGWSWWNAAGRPNYEWDDFYLDAIRIYDPANDGANSTVVKDAYVSDNEGWPSYQELRNMLITMQTFDALGEEDEVEGIIFIDGNAALDQGQIADYISFGPNNELYLAPGQAVAFNLNVNATDENTAAIHLGLKSVGGTAMAKVYNAAVNHTAVKAQTLSSASQQYYDITKLDGNTVVIANVGSDDDAILSVTDLKTTYKHEPKNTGRLTVTRTAAKQALASLMAEQPEPVLTPKYPTLSFESEVVYNVYFAAQNPVALEDMGLAIFDSTGTRLLERVPGAVASGELYMVSSNGINAKNLGDETYFKVYADLADGTTVYSGLYSYSARIYAENTLRSSSSSQTQKALAVAMLNYGAAAQTYFSYRTEELMNSGLTQEQKALCGTYSSEMVLPTIVPDSAKLGAELVATEGAFSGKRPTVTFGDRFTINYYFTPAQPVDGEVTLYYWDQSTYEAGQLTLENAQQTTMQLHSDGSYLAAGAPIAAKELNDTVFAMGVYTSGGVTRSTGVLPYSIAQYCHSNTSGSGARTALAEATVVYGHLAAQFFGNW